MSISKKRTRTFRTQSQWQSLIDKQAFSGQSVEKFCNDESLSVSTFYRQRQLLSSCPKAKDSPIRKTNQQSQSFFELTVPESVDSPKQASTSIEPDWCVELLIGDHIVLKVRA
ncbi:MAG: hypothetical protein O2952_08005 [Bacteroidetes bacterium]|nr:hypothetical protein [Bacteroidota bacterium]